MTENEIATRLKSEREARGFTQRQLAQSANVTAAMISMIEQSRTSPSIATLKKILAGMNMSLSEFFAGTDTSSGQWHFKAEDLRPIHPGPRNLGSSNGCASTIQYRQVGHAGQSALQMLYERYAPGADTGPERYAHDADEAGIVIDGEIQITVGDETATLKAGDAYLFNSRIAHRFRNVSKRDCVIVSACTPPTF